MESIKIAFFGTSDRSIPLLEELRNNFQLKLCITKSDVNVGRHQEKKETAVKIWCKENTIPVLTISSLKGLELEGIIEHLNTANVDFIVVADFSFIIPDSLLEKYPNKVINIHFSLLPKYRGASPVQFAILNGDNTTGITYHLVDRKMDTGDVIHQIGYKMAHTETSGYLYDTLFQLAARELPNVLSKYYTKLLNPRPQDEKDASYTFSPTHPNSTFIYKEDAEIDWKKEVVDIDRIIRAFSPWPIAWTTVGQLENNKKLDNSKFVRRDNVDPLLKVKIYQATINKNNTLEILSLQPEGKNKLTWNEFMNGYGKTSK